MPAIKFNSPVVEKKSIINDERAIKIDGDKTLENSTSSLQKELKVREEKLALKEKELQEWEESLKRKTEKIKLVIQAMIKKDEQLKNRNIK